MAKKPSKRDKNKTGGGGPFKRSEEKKRAAEQRKAQRQAENEAKKQQREAERQQKERERAEEKRQKDEAKHNKKAAKEREKEAARQDGKKKPFGQLGQKDKPTPPPSPSSPPAGPGHIGKFETKGPVSLTDIFGRDFVSHDQSVKAEAFKFTGSDSPPARLVGIAEQIAPLHVRPELAVKDWRAEDQAIRANRAIAETQDAIARLRGDIPLLLFPVRIETRFTDKVPYRLQVRVFPDQLAVDGLERRLTNAEVTEGKAFLEAYDEAEDIEQKRGLWEGFCGSGDPWRSAWIVRCLRSGKFGKREAGEPDAPAIAPILPDRWLVTGIAGNDTFHAAGNPIPPDLAFSPDFSNEISPNGDLSIDPAVNWMVDFQEAVRKGMALDIKLPDAAYEKIDDLYVVGIRTLGPEKDFKPLPVAKAGVMFEELIKAHHYDWGAGFVPAGTATNNTSAVRSDWAFNKPDLEAMRLRELEPEQAVGMRIPNLKDDGDRALRPIDGLAASKGTDTMLEQAQTAFGLSEDTILRKLEHRQGTERAAARAMNRLLWPVTLGETFNALLRGPEENAIPQSAIDFMRDWFCEHLTGGNPLPALRSSATTYGVLPIESFTRRKPIPQSGGEAAKREELGRRLRALLPEWQAAVPSVLRLSEKPQEIDGFGTPTSRYLGMIRQDSSPAGYATHNVWNLRDIPNGLYTLGEQIAHPKHNPVDIQLAFEDRRDVEFMFTIGEQLKFPVPMKYSMPVRVTFRADVLLSDLWEAAGLTHYCDWPDSFHNGAHQEEVLLEKIALLDATLDVNSGIFEKEATLTNHLALSKKDKTVRLDIEPRILFSALIKPVKANIEKIRNALQGMLDQVVKHKLANSQFVQAFDPPDDVYTGILGDQDTDPRLTWLNYYSPAQWPKEKLVEIDAGRETVTVAAYMTDLAAYAEAKRLDRPTPPATQFPDNDVPMLYRLLRTAVTRVADLPDASSAEIAAEFDREVFAPGARVELDAKRIGDLSQRIKGVGLGRQSKGVGSKRTRDSDALARTLAARDKSELTGLAKKLRKEASKPTSKSGVPAKEAKALADELDRVAKLPHDKIVSKLPDSIRTDRSRRLGQMREALELMAKLNAEQVELLMQQTMGLASWRLDAWLTSLTTQRLFDLRQNEKTAKGLQIGAFGWVEDLQRDPRNAEEAHEVRSQGFIHTPTLTHAKAAAILRSGWNAYGEDRDQSPLAVDLSSERMRFAEWAFASISRGQDAGDLLGREFERILRHTYAAPEWIFPIRQAVLTMAGEEPDPNLPVVDGLELQRQWQTDPKRLQEIATEQLKRLGGTRKLEFARVTRALAKLDERIDALADAGLAEAMFALVQGNPDRAGAQLSAISDGIRGASDLQMLSTAPSTMTQVHRVVMLAPDQGGWARDAGFICPLAVADPASEAIAAQWVGSPDQLAFRYDVREVDGTPRAQGELHWSDLLTAKSSFGGGALMAMKAATDGGWSQECELALRLKGFLQSRDANLLEGAQLSIRPAPETEMKLELISAWREVLFGARTLHPRDCGAELGEGTAEVDLGGLEARSESIQTAWREAASALMALLPEPVDGDPYPLGTAPAQQVRSAILDLLKTGWTPALSPSVTIREDAASAYAAAWSLVPKIEETRTTLRQFSPKRGQASERSAEEDLGVKTKRARSILNTILGANLAYAAKFMPADKAGVASAVNAAPQRARESTLDMRGWLEKLAYVREPLRRLNDAILLLDCSDLSEAGATLSAAQWPRGGDHDWIAIAPPPERDGPNTSWLMVGDVPNLTTGQPIAGIVIDEIIDKLPSTQTNTGVAVHFDAPNNEAPQTLLLALPPEGEKWSHELLLDTLGDCFEMARMRPVDSDVMPDFNPILPAIWADQGLKPGGSNGSE